jgi:uncharacterized protein (TIGR02145 family)
MKLLFLALLVLFVGCSNDAVSSHEVVPIAGDISSSAVTQSSSSREIVEHSSSSREESCSSAEEMASSSSELLSSSSESAGSSSSSEQESSSSSVLEVKSSSSSSLVLIYGEMTDERDDQKYKTLYIEKIDRTWMAQNLNYAYLQPTATLDSSSWCYFDIPEECEYGGRLYIWSAAMDSAALFSEDGKGCGNGVACTFIERVQGVCPKGWHLPSKDEWVEMCVTLNGRYPFSLVIYPFSPVVMSNRPSENSYMEKTANEDVFDFGLLSNYSLFWLSGEDYERKAVAGAWDIGVEVEDFYGIKDDEGAYSVRCVKDYDTEE